MEESAHTPSIQLESLGRCPPHVDAISKSKDRLHRTFIVSLGDDRFVLYIIDVNYSEAVNITTGE